MLLHIVQVSPTTELLCRVPLTMLYSQLLHYVLNIFDRL